MGTLAWVVATAALLAVGAVATVLRFREMHSQFDILTADETDDAARPTQPPAPVEEWDTYAVTYQHPARFHPLTEWFAAESPEAATEAALEGNPGATVIEVLNMTGNDEYERGAR